MPDPNVDPKTSAALIGAGDVRPNVAFASEQPAPAAPDLGSSATAAPAMAPVAQPAVPPVTATSPNKHLMSLGARILGALTGEPAPSYKIDPNTGQMATIPGAPLTTSQKIGKIVGTALQGLSAPTPAGRPSLTANMGAGAKAVQEQAEKQDLLKRAQEKESFEEQQQTMLRKHEIARSNALTYATQLENEKRQNDLNPIYAQNESLFKAVKDSPELGAHANEISGEQALAEAEKDPTFTQTHIIRPMGKIPVTDENGQPVTVTGPDGVSAPKMQMRYAVIDGTKDGKVKVTPEMAADFQKYGAMARIPNANAIKAGDEYELSSLLPAMNRVDEQRKAVLEGWNKSELGWATDPKTGKETPVEINKIMPPGSPDAIRPLAAKPMALAAEEGKTALEKAQAVEAYGKAREDFANAALISGSIGGGGAAAIPAYMAAISKLPASSQAILRNVPPSVQMALLKGANGDATVNKLFPTRTTKGSGQLDAAHAANLMVLLNSKWTEGLADKKAKDMIDFSTGENGKAIKSFGQFAVHADQAVSSSENVRRTNSPLLNKPLLYLKTKAAGQPGVPALLVAIQTMRSEWQNFIKNGHAADLADTEEGREIVNDTSSAAQILDAAKAMGHTGVARLDQIDAIWRRDYDEHYPGLISDSARQAFTNLGLGDAIKQYPAESGGMFGVTSPNSISSSQTPPGMVQVQIPGQPAGYIPQDKVDAFKAKHPNATISQ